ncbi:hypothetical protein BDC45DRAFT_572189 [Circinella umbellata]|nr:hypothetical protein BDC45DRAFT_572189 [Circinella umbellata]
MDIIRKWVFEQDNDMLARTICGSYYSLFIHLGYAVEFALPNAGSEDPKWSLRELYIQNMLLFASTGIRGMDKDNANNISWLDIIRQSLSACHVHCIKGIRALALGQIIIYRDAFGNHQDLWFKAVLTTLKILQAFVKKQGDVVI